MSKIVVIAISFVVLVVLREIWRICMVFYNARQVRELMMETWYQWSIHGNRLSMMKRLVILASIVGLYEVHGIEILPGLLSQEEIANFMDENQGMTEEEIVQITDRLFNRINEIRNSRVVEAEMV